jgi:hypothetical protein
MPSPQPLPTVRDFITAGKQAITGQLDDYGDVRSGSMYDHLNGPYATLMAREAAADRDKFRAIYISSAQGKTLSAVVSGRLGVDRIAGTYGLGSLLVQRASSAGGAGKFWTGTRIQVPGSPPGIYEVAQDTTEAASSLSATVPIQATATGPGSAVQGATGGAFLDPIWDATWSPVSLSCAAGTDFEKATDYVARARTSLLANRNGYLAKLQTACASIGAVNAIAFDSSTGFAADDVTDDYGLNAIYVGDANFGATSALVDAAAVALESCRTLGAELWVGGITQSVQSVVGTVYLTDSPGNLPSVVIARACMQAVLASFPAYAVKVKALEARVAAASPYIQQVTITTPGADTSVPTIKFSDEGGKFPNPQFISETWPSTLTVYTTSAQRVSLTLTGPS